MKILPAIDVLGGKCVRLSKGDYKTKIVYNENPLEVAKKFEAFGIKHLHLVDLDGAKSKHIVNYKILQDICSKTSLKVDFGGGIKDDKDVKIAFESGAHQITVGSIAVNNPDAFKEWLHKYGKEKLILGADCIKRKVATSAWLDNSDLDVIEFIQGYEKESVKYVICTDIAKDGMLQGPSIELYKEILELTSVKLIASGGVSSIKDLIQLKQMGCEGAIVGKAIYEGKISLKEISNLC
jgi:phosphoribosylformimino-5-aminoimidazole carboxamide ribotide isomerase